MRIRSAINLKSRKWFMKLELKIIKRSYALVIILGLFLTIYSGCKKSDQFQQPSIDNETLIKSKLIAAGFDLSQGFSKYGDKYIVENDILLSVEEINNLSKEQNVIDLFKSGINEKLNNNVTGSKDKTSHYVGNNLLSISSSIRTIYIYMPTSFGTYIQNSLDSAINRYNALDLGLVFSRTTSSSSADISINATYIDPYVDPDNAYLMLAGFPSGGNPYNQISINTYFYNSSYNRNDAITSLAHEMGHTIGFRHTDYMNRAFSCGVVKSNNNEGSGSGANHVIGTPGVPDIYTPGSFNSWMLACSNGSDRPFTEADIVSLKEVYGYRKNIYVKPVYTFISDESGSSGYNDHEKTTWNTNVEFYQDAALTIPYTTANYLMLSVWYGPQNAYLESRILIPNGVTSYNLGDYTIDLYYTYGTLTADDSTGNRLKNGGGYYGPY
ncbi:hypothetical protein FA048_15555 [Pedobacter polaris]|uniref:Dual-action HEIGH metallo-peptidase n=1 Tax=Pedobacter polaris TaxID=2571273 RepID=A0A4U1CH74_9SPHI|nr:M57 family metalloprotease [Pedobacter polaris]TKC06621.1 hypothetical protein FA048_15555 [Pedobacter polaris]